MKLSRNTLAAIYYLAALGLIAVGTILQLSGHGNGSPYWGLGIVMALGPSVVTWFRQKLNRAQTH